MLTKKYSTLLCATILAVSSPVFAQDITSDLIIDVPFANEVFDFSSYSTVTESGSETYVEDRFGSANCALYFGGSPGEYVELASNSDNELVTGDEFTVSLWFKVNNDEMGNFENLFRKNDTGDDLVLALYDLNTPLCAADEAYIWDDAWNADPVLLYDTLDWHHLVFVGTDTEILLYRDNVLQNSETIVGGPDVGATAGNYFMGSGYTGALDDLKVYKRALSVADINTLYELEGNCLFSGFDNLNEEDSHKEFKVVQAFSKSIQITDLPKETKDIEILNIMGERIYSLSNIEDSAISVDLENFPTGVYFVRASGEKGYYETKKFVLR